MSEQNRVWVAKKTHATQFGDNKNKPGVDYPCLGTRVPEPPTPEEITPRPPEATDVPKAE
jgi:hypothetical protein